MKYLVLGLCILCFETEAFAQVRFQKLIGNNGRTEFPSFSYDALINADDGGYFIAGTNDFSVSADPFLMKVDRCGTIEWSTIIDIAPLDRLFGIEKTSEGGCVAVGYTVKNSTGGATDIFVTKIDASGQIDWYKVFDGGNQDRGYDIHQTLDGGYLITSDAIGGANDRQVVVFKLDISGDLQWAKQYRHPEQGPPAPFASFRNAAIDVTLDSGFVIAGTAQYVTYSTGYSGILIKCDKDGNVEWEQNYSYPVNYKSIYNLIDVKQLANKSYVLSGSTQEYVRSKQMDSTSLLSADATILCVDSLGNVLWNKVYGVLDSMGNKGGSIVASETLGDGIVFCGTFTGTGGTDIMTTLFGTDNDGNVQWAKSYGNGSGINGRASLAQSSDGGYAMLTNITKMTTDSSNANLYLIKTDSFGNGAFNDDCMEVDFTVNQDDLPIDTALDINIDVQNIALAESNIAIPGMAKNIDYDTYLCSSDFFVETIGDTLICDGEVISLYASGGNKYLWWSSTTSLTDSVGDTIVISANESSTYIVEVSDTHMCPLSSKFDTIEVTVHAATLLEINDTIICLDDTLYYALGQSYESAFWSPYLYIDDSIAFEQTIIPQASVEYSVVAQDSVGCLVVDSFLITVLLPGDTMYCQHQENDETYIFIPNVFTPDNDGINDEFRVLSSNLLELKMEIFNRYGKKLYEDNSLTPSWEGFFENELVEAGVYVCYVKGVSIDNENIILTTSFTAIH